MLSLIYIFLESKNQVTILITFLVVLFFIIFFDKNIFKIKKIKIKFLRECKNRVEEMSDRFPVLFNYIDSRNKLHLTWLKWCGFKIINEKTFNDVLFYGFLKEKKK